MADKAERVTLMRCAACGHLDTVGHPCPEMDGLTSANGEDFIAAEPLRRWLDDQIKQERQGSTPSDDAALERIRTLRNVKAHIEGRGTHD